MATPEQIAAWQRLTETAEAWTKAKDDRQARNALHAVAVSYSKAFAGGDAKPGAARSSSKTRSGQVVPFGRSKGTPIEEADTKDLQWLLNAVSESVDDPSKERWREKNVALRDAIQAELETR
jgi:hypothetical protein